MREPPASSSACHRLADLLYVSENAVDFRGADADAAQIENPVGTAMHPPTAMGRGLDQIAMRPEAGVLGEIGGMEARAVGVTVKAKGARGERVGADQLADPRLRIVGRRQRTDIEAEAAALRLAAMDGQVRIAQDKAADDVGATRDRLQRHHRFYPTADPVVLAGIQDGAGGEHSPQVGKVEHPSGGQACLLAKV
jgi:hypothetical protein